MRAALLELRASKHKMPDFPIKSSGAVETVRFPRKMLLEQSWTGEKMPLMEDASHLPITSATGSLSNMPDYKPKNEPRGLSGGLPDLQTGSESIRRASSQNDTKRPFMWAVRLAAGSDSIRSVSVRSSLKLIPRDSLCGL